MARRIFLRGIVLVTEILWSRSIRFRLALFGFGVHIRMRGSIGVVMFFDGGVFLLIVDMLCMINALVLEMLVVTVRLVKCFSLAKLGMTRLLAGFGSVPQRFARQCFRVQRRRNLRRRRSVRLRVPMPVFVILEIFENVAYVQESVAIEANVDESGLHARKHSGNSAFVDTTDQRELFFALDINFN
jgi:hypothetical protein